MALPDMVAEGLIGLQKTSAEGLDEPSGEIHRRIVAAVTDAVGGCFDPSKLGFGQECLTAWTEGGGQPVQDIYRKQYIQTRLGLQNRFWRPCRLQNVHMIT